jgi:hypothetical protein
MLTEVNIGAWYISDEIRVETRARIDFQSPIHPAQHGFYELWIESLFELASESSQLLHLIAQEISYKEIDGNAEADIVLRPFVV